MSSPSPIVRLPLAAMAAVLAALTVVALILASDSAFRPWGWWRLAFFAIPVVLAAYYLSEYRKLPYEPWHFFPTAPALPPTASPTPAVTLSIPVSSEPVVPASASVAAPPPTETAGADEPPGPDEPFDDPVEEADRREAEERRAREQARRPGAPGSEDPNATDAGA